MTIPATASVAALCGLLMVSLAARISALRFRHKISLGDGGNRDLGLAMRLHGNTAEHVPLYLILSLVYELAQGTDRLLIVCGAAFVLSRALFTWGMWRKAFSRSRQLGILITYLAQAALSVALLAAVLRA